MAARALFDREDVRPAVLAAQEDLFEVLADFFDDFTAPWVTGVYS